MSENTDVPDAVEDSSKPPHEKNAEKPPTPDAPESEHSPPGAEQPPPGEEQSTKPPPLTDAPSNLAAKKADAPRAPYGSGQASTPPYGSGPRYGSGQGSAPPYESGPDSTPAQGEKEPEVTSEPLVNNNEAQKEANPESKPSPSDALQEPAAEKEMSEAWRGAYPQHGSGGRGAPPQGEKEAGLTTGTFRINDETQPEVGPAFTAPPPSGTPRDSLFAFPRFDQPPVHWRELLALVLMVVLCDLTIYRSHGFAGLALLFALAPVFLWLGAPTRKYHLGFWVVCAMTLLLSVKLLWAGSILLVVYGFGLMAAFAMTLTGRNPYVLDTVIYATQTGPAGFEGAAHLLRSSRKFSFPIHHGPALTFTLPLAALLAFSTIFLLANPDLSKAFGDGIARIFNTLNQWLRQFSPSIWEFLFWIGALTISIGLLRPIVRKSFLNHGDAAENEQSGKRDFPNELAGTAPVSLFAPLRNTLVAVIALFAFYLIFEFKTLWFRDIPEGFYYAGYAHQGAAWLTAALALATVVLSLIFQGPILREPRLPLMRTLAWIWSAENILLSVSVYNRLSIYLGYNGLSQMRMVGFFGITTVVVGFVIVVWKILHNRDFVWLLRRHLWALALAIYLFALVPIDRIVTGYNVRRIMGGDSAPSVQISVHHIGPEGVLRLLPLLECDDLIIREGVRALLYHHLREYEEWLETGRELGWTTRQLADNRVLEQLSEARGELGEEQSDQQRTDALNRFFEYANQWY